MRRNDPAIVDRLGREAFTGAAMHAMLDAISDPACARVEWQVAVNASPDRVLRGLAIAPARQG